MKNSKVFDLEELFDKRKFASVEVAIHYGDNLLKNINQISKQLQRIMSESDTYNFSKNTKEMLDNIKLELKMMAIGIGDMQKYLTGYQEKIEPSKTDDIAATKDYGFTEEELERLKKQKQPEIVPEKQVELEQQSPENYKRLEE